MKKQITIDGQQSDWFEKAVFVLKESKTTPIPNNLFQYAEHLVENQLKKSPISFNQASKKTETPYDPYLENLKLEAARKHELALKRQKKAKMIDAFLYISISFCFICVMFLLFKIYS